MVIAALFASPGSARAQGVSGRGADLNPSLQIIATYQVQQAGRAPLDIRGVIAFLAFGRSSSSLLQFSGTGLEGGGAGGSSLAGNVAALATRQLASVAVGAIVDEVRPAWSRPTITHSTWRFARTPHRRSVARAGQRRDAVSSALCGAAVRPHNARVMLVHLSPTEYQCHTQANRYLWTRRRGSISPRPTSLRTATTRRECRRESSRCLVHHTRRCLASMTSSHLFTTIHQRGETKVRRSLPRRAQVVRWVDDRVATGRISCTRRRLRGTLQR